MVQFIKILPISTPIQVFAHNQKSYLIFQRVSSSIAEFIIELSRCWPPPSLQCGALPFHLHLECVLTGGQCSLYWQPSAPSSDMAGKLHLWISFHLAFQHCLQSLTMMWSCAISAKMPNPGTERQRKQICKLH